MCEASLISNRKLTRKQSRKNG